MSAAAPGLFVDGVAADAHGEVIEVVSPHTEAVVARVVGGSAADVDRAVAMARRAFDHGPWPRLAPAERVEVVGALLDAYEARATEMAEVISTEMGAPLAFARRAHVGLPLALARSLCDQARTLDWHDERAGAFGGRLVVRREPVGVVAAVVPWNMPQLLTLTKVVPALIAGCAVVVKPAPETPLDALALAELVAASDLPPGVVGVVAGGADTGAQLVGHPGVDKVSFTGSTEAGRRVAGACAANLTPVTLELGGKSAAIVLDDADPDEVATGVRIASLSNSGQICNALTRVLVPTADAGRFTDALVAAVEALRVGDPADPATDLGPLVSARHLDRVQGHLAEGLAAGAQAATGGPGRPDGLDHGWYARPTVLTGVDNAMAIARREVFGPVLCVIPYADEDEAVRIANDSDYGLAGAVWTADPERGLELAGQVRAGTFGINGGYNMDPVAPFGGVRGSGYGRELGPEGFDGYLATKSISGAG